MLEAECTRCGETFVPHGVEPEDIIHGETADGDPCGGIGIIQGRWISLEQAGKTITEKWENFQQLIPFEMHGRDEPSCNDPICKWHHPELCFGCKYYTDGPHLKEDHPESLDDPSGN